MATKAAGNTDTASAAQNRFVVSLPKDVGTQIDEVGKRLSKALEAETGVAFELSRAQIVQALVRQALTHESDTPAQDDGKAADGPTEASEAKQAA